jgi:DNA excision repair protein ERCC-1
MSSDGTGDNQKRPIVNPYTRKRKDPPTSTATGQAAASGNKSTGIAPVAISGAATFSQAFESIEETSHYKTQQTSRGNPQAEKARAEQRALDQAEKNLSDLDHHALLQQPHVLYVSTRQRGNGILKYVRNVPFAYSKMVPDYIMATTSCALFLSLKYHHLYPEYVHRRIAELSNMFKLRVLLTLVDVDDNAQALLRLNKISVVNNMTLVLAWTEEEAARYLETYKALDGKDASSIQKREQTNFVDQVADFFTACKPVNKTDSTNLLDHFSTIRAVAAASKDELALCPGLGQVKVQKLYDALHKPFSKRKAADRKKKRLEQEKAKGADDTAAKDAEDSKTG